MLPVLLTFLLFTPLLAPSPQALVRAVQESSANLTYAKTISATLASPQFQQVLATGHRGAPLHAPENTLPSFEKAIELVADIIEIDVR